MLLNYFSLLLEKIKDCFTWRESSKENIILWIVKWDRLCGLVVRVLGYRFGGPGIDSQALQDFPTKKKKGKQVVGLERGSLSLVSTTELLDRKVAAPV
jgi:hypothetical protein